MKHRTWEIGNPQFENNGVMQTAIRLDKQTHELIAWLATYNGCSFNSQVKALLDRALVRK